MARTAEHKEAQLQALVDLAEQRIAQGGVAGLKARDLAAGLGCAVGAIYNLVDDMDALILLVRARTLARLDALVAAALPGPAHDDPERAQGEMVAVALAYCRFARANLNLWRTMFEHRARERRLVPQTALAQQTQIFGHIMRPLRVKLPGADEIALALLSRTLFAAVHGVTVVSLDETLLEVPAAALEAQVEQLVTLVARGLDAAAARAG